MAHVSVSNNLSTCHGKVTSLFQQQWESDLQMMEKRTLEQKCPGSSSRNRSSSYDHGTDLNAPNSAEFLKLCDRVDLLEAKLSAVKAVLEEVLNTLSLNSSALDKHFRQCQSPVLGPPSEAAKASRNKKDKEADLLSYQDIQPQQYEPGNQDEQEFIGAEDEDGDDGWLFDGVEAAYDDNEDEMVDMKPFIDTLATNDSELWEQTEDVPKRSVRPKVNTKPVMELNKIQDPLGLESQMRCPPLDSNSLEKNFATNMFECPVCHKEFKERTKVERHYVVHSGERPFACVNCQKTFTRKDKLTEHYRSEHPINIPPEHVFEKKEKKTYTCPDCGKVSGNRGNHEDHLNACRGNKPHICPHCGRGFTQNASLRTHIHCVHQKIKRFLCHDCGKTFSISTSYERHMRMHRGERPYACKYCDKMFSESSALSRHHKAHAGIKTIKCHLCDLTFYKCYALNQHMKTHTGEKEFACDECGTMFGQVGSLNKHKLLHLNNGKVRLRKSYQRKAPYKPREPKVAFIPELSERVSSSQTQSSKASGAGSATVTEEQFVLSVDDQILQKSNPLSFTPTSSTSSFSLDCNFEPGFLFRRQSQP